jgi:hypothetical protein
MDIARILLVSTANEEGVQVGDRTGEFVTWEMVFVINFKYIYRCTHL